MKWASETFATFERFAMSSGIAYVRSIASRARSIRRLISSAARAMTFDSTRNRTILWGGGNSAFVNLNDTWEFDGTSWLQRTPSTSPPALVGSAMAFDANRHVSVMFGGSGFPGNSAATWEWDGTNWTLPTVATSPAARFSTTMAYASARG